jgi:hypothetical protein
MMTKNFNGKNEPSIQKKRAPKRPVTKEPPSPTHKQQFNQLLDDAVLGVKKKEAG